MPWPGAHGSDLVEFAKYIVENGPRKTQPSPRRVRVIYNGQVIVDTTKALFVWEQNAYPHYYVRRDALQNCQITDLKEVIHNEKQSAAVAEVLVGGKNGLSDARCDRVVRFFDDESLGPLAGLVRLEFGSMEHWLEEESPIYVHPKDPFKRIDILPSLRHIEIRINGQTVASSTSAQHLYETSLPTRYYLPLGSVDHTVLRPSKTVTRCPYKGDAEYYNVVVGGQEFKDIVWYYRLPTLESLPIAGLVCFYNEKVDVYVDGKLEEKPRSPFA